MHLKCYPCDAASTWQGGQRLQLAQFVASHALSATISPGEQHDWTRGKCTPTTHLQQARDRCALPDYSSHSSSHTCHASNCLTTIRTYHPFAAHSILISPSAPSPRVCSSDLVPQFQRGNVHLLTIDSANRQLRTRLRRCEVDSRHSRRLYAVPVIKQCLILACHWRT
jgi:hypothetical protein